MLPDLDPQADEAPPSLAGLPSGVRASILWKALRLSAAERRTKRALFFTSASLLVGFTVAQLLGVLLCGLFGGSLYIVVLVLRMQRHIRSGSEEYRARESATD